MAGLFSRLAAAVKDDWRALAADARGFDRRDAAGALAVGGSRSRAVWPTLDSEGQAAAGYRIAVAFACIDRIASDVSVAKLRVYAEQADGKPEEQRRHPARLVVADPNPGQSEAEFWWFVVAMAATTGFCVVEKVRSGAGRPVQLWPLVSPWLKVKPRDQSAPDWEYRVPGNDPWLLPAEDVIVVTYRPDRMGGHTGWSPLSALRRELRIDDDMTDFLNVLLQRGGVPPIGLRVLPQGESKTVPKLEQAEADALVERWTQRYGGAGNWGRPVFLGGLQPERIGLDLGEMLWPDVREMVELHVCSVFGVPAGRIGTAAGLARNTYSNAETDDRKYYDGTVAPLWGRLDGAFTRGLLSEFLPGPGVSFEFDLADIAALQDDEAPRWDRAIRAAGGPFLTVDDARAEVHLPPLPNGAGDVILLPFSVTPTKPADLAAIAAEAAKPPAPVPAALTPFVEGQGDDDEEEDEEPEEGKPAAENARVRSLHPLPPQRRAAAVANHKAAMARLAGAGAPKLAAFWRAQGERVVGAATRSEARFSGLSRREKVAMPGAELDRLLAEVRDLSEVDWDDEERLLAEVLRPFYALNGEAAFAAAADQLGVSLSFDLANPNVRRVLKGLAGRIVGIHATTRDDVRRVVGAALDEGVALPELADRLRSLFDETYRGRALTVARTESQVAYNTASALGYRESGVVASVELADNPNHTEGYKASDGLTCAQRDGLIVPLGQEGAHIEAEHPNGSLAVLPVLIKPLGDL